MWIKWPDVEQSARIKARFVYDEASGFVHWKVPYRKNRAGDRAETSHPDGYTRVCTGVDGVQPVLTQILAFFLKTGRWPYPTVDHIDENKRNNKWENLREASYKEQGENHSKPNVKRGGARQKVLADGTPVWQANAYGKALDLPWFHSEQDCRMAVAAHKSFVETVQAGYYGA